MVEIQTINRTNEQLQMLLPSKPLIIQQVTKVVRPLSGFYTLHISLFSNLVIYGIAEFLSRLVLAPGSEKMNSIFW